MSALSQLKAALNIPNWFILTASEIQTLTTYLIEAGNNVDQAFWAIRLDCAACCSGCALCDLEYIMGQPLCKARHHQISRGN